jgi:hypothetical protein
MALGKTPIENPSLQQNISGKRGKTFQSKSNFIFRTVFRHKE